MVAFAQGSKLLSDVKSVPDIFRVFSENSVLKSLLNSKVGLYPLNGIVSPIIVAKDEAEVNNVVPTTAKEVLAINDLREEIGFSIVIKIWLVSLKYNYLILKAVVFFDEVFIKFANA